MMTTSRRFSGSPERLGGSLEPASFEVHSLEPTEIPISVAEYFRRKAHVAPDQLIASLEQFGGCVKVLSDDKIVTFAVLDDRINELDGQPQQQIYLADALNGRAMVGRGLVRYSSYVNNDDGLDMKPYSDGTETYPSYIRRGLGARRLMAMGRLCRTLYGQPLHSGHSRTPEATAVWESLVTKSLAEKYREIYVDRYTKKPDFRLRFRLTAFD